MERTADRLPADARPSTPGGLRAAALAVWNEHRPGIVLALVAAVLYQFTSSEQSRLDWFVPLADAFLRGDLHVPEGFEYLENVPRREGGLYSPFPPGPVLTVLPLVAILGADFEQGTASTIYGSLNVFLLWFLLGRIGVAWEPRAWLTAAFAFGTVHWWSAGQGSVWNYAHVVAVMFLLGALILAVQRRAPLAAGLLLGLAAASRLPTGLSLPLFLALYGGLSLRPWRDRPNARHWRAMGLVLLGLAVPAVLVALYNVARFGNPLDFGYTRINGVLEEPFYREGILSLSYIPRHIHTMFLRGFDYVDDFPWFRPNWTGTSLLLTAPILLWLVRVRSRAPLVGWLWLSVALVLVPIVTHGNVGFAQWSYRFVLDVAPLLFLMLGLLFRERISSMAKAAIVIGVLANAYGVWTTVLTEFVAY